MSVRRLGSAAEFLAATLELRGADPVRTNVIGSVATGVATGLRRYDDELWLVAEDGGEVVGAALRTAPFRLLVSPMTDDVAREVGATVAAADPEVPGVIGPVETAYAVAQGAGRPARPHMRERILVLEAYEPATGVVGTARAVAADDHDLAWDWTVAFAHDAGVMVNGTRATFAPPPGSLWFWEVDGSPVAMAGHAPVVATPAGDVGRVGPVYTPEPLRRNGYGAAVTSAVVDHLIPRTDLVMLYTDEANPTSNRVYERLGFRHVADVVDLDLLPG